MFARLFVAVAVVSAVSGCSRSPEEHDHGPEPVRAGAAASASASVALPGSATTVAQKLQASPRHGEWAMIRTAQGDSVRAWVVYPERATNAPVVLVVHEIFGLSAWVRGVADQMAAAGFIAIAPDLLTGKGELQGDSLPSSVATSVIRTLRADDVHRQLEAVAQYGMSLPAAAKRYGIVGFCWGGSTSFAHAVRSPAGLGASVVYYGASPDTVDLARVRVPVLGLYAGDDQRINARIPATDSVMKRLGKPYEFHFFDGAGHGFLRQQEGREGANQRASDAAWPRTVSFFRRHLGS
jgi:carboxymethylenebutenolidase